MAKQEKLKNYEIEALADKIFSEIKDIKINKVKQVYGESIKTYIKEYTDIDNQIKKLEKDREKLSEKYKEKLKIKYIYRCPGEETLLENLADCPSCSEIKSEIILKGIFSNKSELEGFIKELVKKFS